MGDIWDRVNDIIFNADYDVINDDSDDDDNDEVITDTSEERKPAFRKMTPEEREKIIEGMAYGGALCLHEDEQGSAVRSLCFDYEKETQTPILYFPNYDMAQKFLELCDNDWQETIPPSNHYGGVLLVYEGEYGSYMTYPAAVFDFMRLVVQQEDRNQRKMRWVKEYATRARKNSNVVIERTGRTTVLTRYVWEKGYGRRGHKFRADCAECDICNPEIGIAVAYAKAFNITIPDFI